MRRQRGEILELSLVRRPGNTQTRPLRVAPLDAVLAPRGMPSDWGEVWARAKDSEHMARDRTDPRCLRIDDRDELSIDELCATDPAAGRRALTLARARRENENERVQRRAPSPAGPGVVFHGQRLGPALSRKVRDMLADEVPVTQVVAFVRASR